MGQIVDLTGKVFGRWTVQGLSHQKGKVLFWKCRCDCGTERAIFGGDLKRGGSLSCGCLMREKNGSLKRTHGLARHPAYRSWVQMKSRCENPSRDGFEQYGGRGIKVADCWATFEGFWRDMGPTWEQGRSIDRWPNVDGNYEPGNCRWATPREQANNRRTNVVIDTPKGQMTITEAARAFGLSPFTITSRIRYGWPDAELLKPARPSRKAER